jgi:hypothetical protein
VQYLVFAMSIFLSPAIGWSNVDGSILDDVQDAVSAANHAVTIDESCQKEKKYTALDYHNQCVEDLCGPAKDNFPLQDKQFIQSLATGKGTLKIDDSSDQKVHDELSSHYDGLIQSQKDSLKEIKLAIEKVKSNTPLKIAPRLLNDFTLDRIKDRLGVKISLPLRQLDEETQNVFSILLPDSISIQNENIALVKLILDSPNPQKTFVTLLKKHFGLDPKGDFAPSLVKLYNDKIETIVSRVKSKKFPISKKSLFFAIDMISNSKSVLQRRIGPKLKRKIAPLLQQHSENTQAFNKKFKDKVLASLESLLREKQKGLARLNKEKDSAVTSCYNRGHYNLKKKLSQFTQSDVNRVFSEAHDLVKKNVLPSFSPSTRAYLNEQIEKSKIEISTTFDDYQKMYSLYLKENQLKEQLSNHDKVQSEIFNAISSISTRRGKKQKKTQVESPFNKDPREKIGPLDIFNQHCRTLSSKIPLTNNHVRRGDDEVRIVQMGYRSLLSPKMGVAIHTHEIGHIISSLIGSFSGDSSAVYENIKGCTEGLHSSSADDLLTERRYYSLGRAVDESSSIDWNEEDEERNYSHNYHSRVDGHYSEEDFADVVSAMASKDTMSPVLCKEINTIEVNKNKYVYTLQLLEDDTPERDTHSTSLYRLITNSYTNTGKHHNSCKNYLASFNKIIAASVKLDRHVNMRSCAPKSARNK